MEISQGPSVILRTIREALQSICNIRMEDCVWSQATLSLSKDGLSIRKSVN